MSTGATTAVGVVQMTSTADVDHNLSVVERLAAQAAQDGARLVVVPECFAYLGPEEGKLAVAEALGEAGPILSRCQAIARSLDVELLLGGFWERSAEPTKVHNTSIHLAASGTIKATYRKVHLFDVDLPDGTKLAESETVAAGSQTVVTDAPFGKLGLSICYDLRFPELYRRLVDGGAIALAIPAAFTQTTGKDHWHILLRARAIEQQCYVLAAAQTGHHYGPRFSYGHAMIVDPWGRILAECEDGEGIAIAEIDPAVVAAVRRSLPSLAHRVL